MRRIFFSVLRFLVNIEHKEFVTVLFLMILIFVAGMNTIAKEQAKPVKTAADSRAVLHNDSLPVDEVDSQDVKVTNERELAERTAQVEEHLNSDIYGEQLRELYTEHPDLYTLIVNRDQYPDWLVEYVLGHEEAIDWVIGYPKAMKQNASEIDGIALESVNLSDYKAQNGIPLFYQWDARWGYASYGNGCIAVDGCGVTALSMVLSGFFQDGSYTPKRIADFSSERGYFSKEEGTFWELMESGARELGLDVGKVHFSASAIQKELSEGRTIIASMGPGDFTQQGHFIVFSGLSEDGRIIVNDPNSRINSQQLWDARDLLDQTKAMWSYKTAQ